VAQISFANVVARTPLPPTYFKMEFSLQADGRPQAITDERFGHGTFSIADAAAQYCFQTDLKVRGPLNATATARQCLSRDDVSDFTGLPLDACTEDTRPVLREDTLLQARIGATEEEARQRPMFSPQGDDVAKGCALDSCAVGSRSGKSGGGWLFALLVLATAARRKLL
jgi:MYXO-CTERM domain-containing protein